MTGCCPNAHRALTQCWGCFKGGTGQGVVLRVRSCWHALRWSQSCHPLGLTFLFRKLWLKETLSFCPSEPQNDKMHRSLACKYFASSHLGGVCLPLASCLKKSSASADRFYLIYRRIVWDFLAWGTQSPLQNEEWAISMCVTLDSCSINYNNRNLNLMTS